MENFNEGSDEKGAAAKNSAETSAETSAQTDGILAGAVRQLLQNSNPNISPDVNPLVDAGQENGRGLRRLFGKHRPKIESSEKIDDVGVIDDYVLPGGFHKVKDSNQAVFDVKEFQAATSPTMKIAYWNWNKPGSAFPPEVSTSFQNVLSQKPHKLDQHEIDSVAQVFPAGLYGYNGNFDILDIRTERLDGRNVLIMENQWRDQDRRSYGIFFPADKSASQVEHLHFEATRAEFRRNWPRVKHSFSRIDLEN